MPSLSFDSPLGRMTLDQEGEDITRLRWGEAEAGGGAETALLVEARAQLRAYFAHRLQRFDLPLSCPSTPFRHGVLEAMFAIPYGETRTYGAIADYVQGSARAVGQACAANPIPILIPCHRVVGVSGPGGYSGAGGTASKRFLLRHEGGAGGLLA